MQRGRTEDRHQLRDHRLAPWRARRLPKRRRPTLPRRTATPCRTATLAAALAAIAFAAAGVRPASAQLTIDLQAGTLGLGGGLEWALAPAGSDRAPFDVRVAGSLFRSGGHDERAGDNRYRARLDLGSAAALLDWRPTGGGFRLSAGALYDANRLEGDSLPAADGTYTIGNLRLPAPLVGTLHGKVDFPSFAPYLGIGWSAVPRAGAGFGGFVDLGVAYQGRPRVTLTPEPPPGSPLNTPLAMALLAPELARETAKVESKIDGYRYYPVLTAGLSYRF